MARINGRIIKVTNDSIVYDKRTYPIAGASATCSERRQGIPGLTRRTMSEVTIMGQGWTLAGLTTSNARAARKLVRDVNKRAYSPDVAR